MNNFEGGEKIGKERNRRERLEGLKSQDRHLEKVDFEQVSEAELDLLEEIEGLTEMSEERYNELRVKIDEVARGEEKNLTNSLAPYLARALIKKAVELGTFGKREVALK